MNLLDINGISKWGETAMRAVPVRSDIVKTRPTNAGPASFSANFSPESLTVEGKTVPFLEDMSMFDGEDEVLGSLEGKESG